MRKDIREISVNYKYLKILNILRIYINILLFNLLSYLTRKFIPQKLKEKSRVCIICKIELQRPNTLNQPC